MGFYDTMNNNVFGHEWGDLPRIFMRDTFMSENYWGTTSQVIKMLYSQQPL